MFVEPTQVPVVNIFSDIRFGGGERLLVSDAAVFDSVLPPEGACLKDEAIDCCIPFVMDFFDQIFYGGKRRQATQFYCSVYTNFDEDSQTGSIRLNVRRNDKTIEHGNTHNKIVPCVFRLVISYAVHPCGSNTTHHWQFSLSPSGCSLLSF